MLGTLELLEREPFLHTLSTLLAEASAGDGRLVMIGGEAGVGKTSLVEHFCREARQSTRLLRGACDPLTTPRPLGPLVDIAATIGGELDDLVRSGSSRNDVFESFLKELARAGKPNLLVFEDLHWADEATLDLVRFLGRRLPATHTLLLATYRDDETEAGHPLRVTLGDLATSPAVRRLSLPVLTEVAVKALAAGKHPDPAALFLRTGGNPFFVTEVLASGGDDVPATVRDTVLARAARLSPAGRLALEAVAVIGVRAETWLLELIGGAGASELDECVNKGLLRPDGRSVAFRHELARAAVLEAIPSARLLELHTLVLAQLRSRAGHHDLARLAHHAEGANAAQAVLEYAPAAAAAAAALGAHREAAAQYSRALRFADQLPLEARATLLEARSYECYLIGQIDEALAARKQALELWQTLPNPLKQGENLRWMSRLLWFAGQGEEADRAALAALELLEAQPPGAQLAWAYSNLAQQRMLSMDCGEAIPLGEKAIELAERMGETEILAHALNNVGSARLVLEEDGWGELERSLQLALGSGLEDHAARAYTNLYFMGVQHREWSRVDRYFHEGSAYCSKHDLDASRWSLLGQRCSHLLFIGQWEESSQLAANLLAQPNQPVVDRINPLVVLGTIRARRGEPDVWPLLDEALELAAPTRELQRLGPVRCARSEAAWLTGDHRAGADEARAGLEVERHDGQGWIVGELALWLQRSGGLDVVPEPIAEPYALEISGDWRAAAARWQQLGCPYEEALALANSPQEEDLRNALAKLEALGARPAASIVARALREGGAKNLPRGPRTTTRANPFNLTAREMEVLELVAAGLRNAEIASRLHVAAKTVDQHVSAILAKTATRSRVEAVMALKDR
jgi:DNA-binding CsgD family transcriptional regulator/tetratricopeptide (TPR) repeat protein